MSTSKFNLSGVRNCTEECGGVLLLRFDPSKAKIKSDMPKVYKCTRCYRLWVEDKG